MRAWPPQPPGLARAREAAARPEHLHDPRTAAVLGIALGLAFSVSFATGILSRLIQQPPTWFNWPSRPAGLYRVTQGVHVATGLATVPLLLAKLWSVYHHFVAWPPFRSVAHAVERIALLPLVGGGLFLLASGAANIANWYPWGFYFPTAHRALAWVTIGALIMHVGAKASVTRQALWPGRLPTEEWATASAAPDENGGDRGGARPAVALSRRGFLGAVAATSGLVSLVTLGQTVAPLRRLAVLAPRRPDVGPQGVPVNKSARAAGVIDAAQAGGYRLSVEGAVAHPLQLTLAELRAMPARRATLPIACVQGWSAEASWTGVAVAELLRRAGARPGAEVRVESLQERGLFRSSVLSADHAADPDTLLAYALDGDPLHIDHGYPVRLIGPNRPGVMQTKWVSKLVVLTPPPPSTTAAGVGGDVMTP